ncbi:class I SAM-dependent methyltransferase [Limnoraphis robusta]|uniref:class I SAM-dependent methyltransferase n=1 Tax=Limnoraphis robusta TaxID=1118279 RepID=UPI002B2095FB|nr:class I SAM-dependent methyltransferase [Limnoraphis robusta]MEA5497923.1 class I SAM-dependent methyltransferase [Limnoraphis robusta BA-68 BA1]
MYSDFDSDRQTILAQINKARKLLRESVKLWNRKYESFIDYAPRLDYIHLQECTLLPDRYELLKKMTKRGTVCEVGTNKGEFARAILELTSPSELHIVDISFENFEYEQLNKQDIEKVSKLHEMDSVQCLSSFPDHYFDWIYIDANHYYEYVKKDLEVAKAKVKNDGYIVCNDYTSWSVSGVTKCGVAKAVNELCLKDNWKFIFFALQGNMYYDVALQKI